MSEILNPQYQHLFDIWSSRFSNTLVRIYGTVDDPVSEVLNCFKIHFSDALVMKGIADSIVQEDISESIRDNEIELTEEEWQAISMYVMNPVNMMSE